jgi:hypothetical protein
VYYVIPQDPANSLLYKAVTGTACFGYMPPPPTRTPIPSEQRTTISDWITYFGETTVTGLAQPPNGGTVTGGGIFMIGLSRTITASANPGWTFFRWDDGNTFNPRNIIVPSCDITYTAVFQTRSPTPTPTPHSPTPTPTPRTPTPTPTGSPTPTAVLGNISTRSFVQTGDNVMIGGFIVQGSAPKTVIIRAIGPELIPFGVPNVLLNPTLELHNRAGALIASNDNWRTTIIGGIITHDQVQEILDSGRAPTDGRESAIIATLPAGNYTAIVRGVNGMTGIALVEIYALP